MRNRRWLARGSLVLVTTAVGVVLASVPAGAEITAGTGCSGDATIAGVNYTESTPQTTPVLMPADDAPPDQLIVPYKGAVGFDNRNHSGNFALMFGPIPIPIVSWGSENSDGDAATGPPTAPPPATEMYDLSDAYDLLPAIRGQFRVRGTHSADGGNCTGIYLIEFPGSAIESPLTIVGIVGAGFSLVLIFISGKLTAVVGGPTP